MSATTQALHDHLWDIWGDAAYCQAADGLCNETLETYEVVRRLNAHDDLLAACEAALDALMTEGSCGGDPDRECDACRMVRQLTTALAKAGRREP